MKRIERKGKIPPDNSRLCLRLKMVREITREVAPRAPRTRSESEGSAQNPLSRIRDSSEGNAAATGAKRLCEKELVPSIERKGKIPPDNSRLCLRLSPVRKISREVAPRAPRLELEVDEWGFAVIGKGDGEQSDADQQENLTEA